MPCNRGDVVLVRFPNSDLQTYKKRPALVVQRDGLSTRIPQRIIALITSNLSRTGPTRIAVSRSTPEGVRMGPMNTKTAKLFTNGGTRPLNEPLRARVLSGDD